MMKHIVLLVIAGLTALSGSAQNNDLQNNSSIQKTNLMDTTQLTNTTVKSAIKALQANDKSAWFSHFTTDAVFTDDGNTKDFKPFFDNAFNHEEKFLSLDKVENDGKDLTGDFYAGQWGTFKVYFNFTLNDEGQISRLDIGQVSKR